MQQDKPTRSRGNLVSEERHESLNTQASSSSTAKPASKDLHVGSASSFINILVTPKITFSLPRRPEWSGVDDIPQEDLRTAFLTRFPIQFDPDHLTFTCATPTKKLSESSECVVFRIGADGVKEERVLLSILNEIDKAYSAKYEKQLEEARADLLSSSMNFQVVADEVRHATQTTSKKWEKDVRSLKDQLSTNQKRLFLLEQEKDQLQRTATSANTIAGQLRRDVAELSVENSELKTRMGELEVQFSAMRAVLASHHAVAAVPPAVPQKNVAVQANVTAEESGYTTEHWNQQLKAVSDWLQTGAALFRDGHMQAQGDLRSNCSGNGAAVASVQSCRDESQADVVLGAPTSQPVRPKWSEMTSEESEA